ncbi:8-oxo-dGTP diphosphatase [invertebrate metagenome]|uniref:Oxidized purine nucleoside triphosphate hydrolase n=1 Tax=invertebrate metagenome TaxID=1711999 RepID=A0A2H9TC77_9ZZZZ
MAKKSIYAFKNINWQHWRPSVHAALVFVIKRGKILLIRKKRGLGAGNITGPGGKVEDNELTYDCAVREIQEELNITPMHLAFSGSNRFQFTDGLAMQMHIYTTSDYIGTPSETDEAAPLWYPVQDIPYDEMWEDDRLWMPLMLSNKSFNGCFLFNDGQMLGYQLSLADNHSND